MNALVQNARRDVPVFKHFTVVPSAPRIGGTIEGMHLSALNPESAEELRRALWHYGVLFAREQHLTPAQHMKVASYFGDELEKHAFGKSLADQGFPEVVKIEMVFTDKGKLTTDHWHHDVTGRKHPTLMSVLQAVEVPFGADTMWASASGAWDLLPHALKLMFLNLDIEHDAVYAVLRHGFANAIEMAQKLMSAGEANTHPAVIHHPYTGRPCLFVGNGYPRRVLGFPTDLSELVLKLANELPKLPELQVRHQWRAGDVAMWDNFGTLHYGVTGDLSRTEPRLLHRVSAFSKNIVPTLDRERAMRELLQSRA